MKRRTHEARDLRDEILPTRPGGTGGTGSTSSATIVPDHVKDRVTLDSSGRPVIKSPEGFRAGDSFALMQEVQNQIQVANDTMFANKDSEVNITFVQQQIQRLQKVFGLLQQNIGNAISFNFKVINFFAEAFGLQTIR
jgi:hypothetical protein